MGLVSSCLWCGKDVRPYDDYNERVCGQCRRLVSNFVESFDEWRESDEPIDGDKFRELIRARDAMMTGNRRIQPKVPEGHVKIEKGKLVEVVDDE